MSYAARKAGYTGETERQRGHNNSVQRAARKPPAEPQQLLRRSAGMNVGQRIGKEYMQPFQQRVIDEKAELDAKIRSLELFIAESTSFPTLPEAERVRMRWQLVFMENYSAVLADRIAAF